MSHPTHPNMNDWRLRKFQDYKAARKAAAIAALRDSKEVVVIMATSNGRLTAKAARAVLEAHRRLVSRA